MTKSEWNRVALAVAECIAECNDGAPEGVMYASLMGILSLDEFNTILDTMEAADLITRKGHVATPTLKLKDICARKFVTGDSALSIVAGRVD